MLRWQRLARLSMTALEVFGEEIMAKNRAFFDNLIIQFHSIRTEDEQDEQYLLGLFDTLYMDIIISSINALLATVVYEHKDTFINEVFAEIKSKITRAH